MLAIASKVAVGTTTEPPKDGLGRLFSASHAPISWPDSRPQDRTPWQSKGRFNNSPPPSHLLPRSCHSRLLRPHPPACLGPRWGPTLRARAGAAEATRRWNSGTVARKAGAGRKVQAADGTPGRKGGTQQRTGVRPEPRPEAWIQPRPHSGPRPVCSQAPPPLASEPRPLLTAVTCGQWRASGRAWDLLT